MNAESERANLVTQTEIAYRRGILVAALAKVGQEHWQKTGDAYGLLLAADLFEGTANLYASLPTVPEQEPFIRGLARADREHAAIIREQVNAYQDTPSAFVAALDPTWAASLRSRQLLLLEELAKLAPAQNVTSAGFRFQLPTQRHTSRVHRLRLLPWLALFLAAWAIGAAAPREWWTIPAIALVGAVGSIAFYRLGLHRLR